MLPDHIAPPAFIRAYELEARWRCITEPKRMSANFDKAFANIVGLEGGYVNDPADPGGETKYGISKRSYPSTDIASLTLDGAKVIYARDFWAPVHGDELPWPLSLFMFDAAVNQGATTAVTMLQKAIGVPQDGALGPRTVKAAAGQDATELCSLFMATRALRYTGTRNFDIEGRGWLKRLFKIALLAT